MTAAVYSCMTGTEDMGALRLQWKPKSYSAGEQGCMCFDRNTLTEKIKTLLPPDLMPCEGSDVSYILR